ncbi:dipeptidyl-peptidase 7 [Scytonema hofmannii PCC 7110]|uniref:Dipeptidyl-peptidase n=1 Tax=Scytonema hofmannii PCC 7110 TaxID=128403 RepID=A0A139WY59_9CYAN|nr:S46 family peptidase [Scytonema hofmannii]KYC37379.1 dipeptidyl-peptidase 7 [Scytonema hofmannii PCC 7110]
MKKVIFNCLLLLLCLGNKAHAVEGMWQPQQLPELEAQLKKSGLQLNPQDLTNLTSHPMAAVISLGGCTASFVSPAGLVLTNHHCAYNSIQYNSKASNNLLQKGFLAKTLGAELPASPGSRVYINVAVKNVTNAVKKSVANYQTGYESYQAITNKKKQLVRQCELDKGHRCEVYDFHGGLEYYLIKQLEIRDVRLVYAPPEGLGRFGGDIDNWRWPRHTGDFAFYRAYVDKNGHPADYSPDNVPYHPQHYLKLSRAGLNPNDFVMVLGYPGLTNRYRLAEEVEHAFGWFYPTKHKIYVTWIETINQSTANNQDAKIKYAGRVGGLNNAAKNFQGMMDSFARSHLIESKRQVELNLQQWIQSNDQLRNRYQANFTNLKALIVRQQANEKQNLPLEYLGTSDLFSIARRLYRLSKEKQKPDTEREPGYQERDFPQFQESLRRLERNFDREVDKAVWLKFIEEYTKLPSNQRIPTFDKIFGLGNKFEGQKVKIQLDAMYQGTSLTDEATRLKWMNADPKTFAASNDPFIQLAVAMFDADMVLEKENQEIEGSLQQLRPVYMEALIAYYRQLKKPVYADANKTLRVTFGRIRGYSPGDGSFYEPFTTLRGITEKYTGAEPFDAPKEQLEFIEKKNYGRYYNRALDSVAVNFLSDLDITGGNSGSPTLNSKGELVGLAFDGIYETIISNWEFTKNASAIHVDITYMLWVMEYLDKAGNLLDEMTVKGK